MSRRFRGPTLDEELQLQELAGDFADKDSVGVGDGSVFGYVVVCGSLELCRASPSVSPIG